MFKRVTSSTLIIALLSPSVAWADDPKIPSVTTPTNESDPGAVISPLRKGDKAPFTGVELSPRAAASIMTDMNTFVDRLRIETDKVRQEDAAQRDYQLQQQRNASDADKKVMQAQLAARQKELDVATARLKESESRATPTFWTCLGAAGGIGFTLLTIWTVTRVTK